MQNQVFTPSRKSIPEQEMIPKILDAMGGFIEEDATSEYKQEV